jgi:hypothetical protein
MRRSARRAALLLLACSPLALTACATMEAEAPIERRDVSPRVLAMLEEMMPGFVIGEIEVEIEDEELTFEFDGVRDGIAYEVEMTPRGDDIEVEVEEEDEDES